MPSLAPSREIIVLGDLHGHYDDADLRFLEQRRPLLCLFIGDLGDEDPDIVREVTKLQIPYRVLLGNHDAWESFRLKRVTPALRESLDLLGEDHFSYDYLDLDELGVSLVGGRPFSWGGPSLRSPEVYEELYGVSTHEDSAALIVDAARAARHQDLVLIAHNGPRGMGSRPGDIWGKDFGKPGGDWGDLDLRIAIRQLKNLGYRIPLVVAGHMHHRLAHPKGEERRRCVVKPDTTYVNAARVPRIFRTRDGIAHRHYLSIRLAAGEVSALDELYVTEQGIEEASLLANKKTA